MPPATIEPAQGGGNSNGDCRTRLASGRLVAKPGLRALRLKAGRTLVADTATCCFPLQLPVRYCDRKSDTTTVVVVWASEFAGRRKGHFIAVLNRYVPSENAAVYVLDQLP